MKRLQRIVDRIGLTAQVWLHRHGPWWLLVAAALTVLLALAVFVLPRLDAELAANLATLHGLHEQLANRQQPAAPATDAGSAANVNHWTFTETLAPEGQVLPTIKVVLDLAASHHLISTRAEYLRAVDAHARAERLQLTIPVKGRYVDIRRWIEEILRTQAHVAVNELAFKREDVGLDQVEAKVRLSIWHHPASPGAHRQPIDAVAIDP